MANSENPVLNLSREALLIPSADAYYNNELNANSDGFVTYRDFIGWLKNTGVFTSFGYVDRSGIKNWIDSYVFNANNYIFNGVTKSNDFVTLKSLCNLGCFDLTKAVYYHVRDNIAYLQNSLKLTSTELDIFLNLHKLRYDAEGLPYEPYAKSLINVYANEVINSKFEKFASNVFIRKETIIKSLCTQQHTQASYVTDFKHPKLKTKWIKIANYVGQIASIDWDLEKYEGVTIEIPLQQEFLECKKNQSNLDYVPTGNERFLSGYMMSKLTKRYNKSDMTSLYMQVTDSDFVKFGENIVKISDKPKIWLNMVYLKLGFYSKLGENNIFQNCGLYSIDGGLYPRTSEYVVNLKYGGYSYQSTAFSSLSSLFENCQYLNSVGDDIFDAPINKDNYIPEFYDFKKSQITGATDTFSSCVRLNSIKTSIFDGCFNITTMSGCFSNIGGKLPPRNLTLDFTRLMHNKRNIQSIYKLFSNSSSLSYEINKDIFKYCRNTLGNVSNAFENSGWTIPKEYNGVFPPIFRDCIVLTGADNVFFGAGSIIWDDLITFDPDLFKNCRKLIRINKLFQINQLGYVYHNPNSYIWIPRKHAKSRTPNFKSIELAQILRDCISLEQCSEMFSGSMIEHLGSDPHYFKNCTSLKIANRIFYEMISLDDIITQPFKGIEKQITSISECFTSTHVDVDLQKFFENGYPNLTNASSCFENNYKVHGTIESDLLRGCPNIETVQSMFQNCHFITHLKKKDDGKGFFDWIPKCTNANYMFYKACTIWSDSSSFVKINTYQDLVEFVYERKYGVIDSNFFSQDGANNVTSIYYILSESGFIVIGDRLFENCHKLVNANFAFNECYGVFYLGHGIFKNCEKLQTVQSCFSKIGRVSSTSSYESYKIIYNLDNPIFATLNKSISYNYDFDQPPIGDGNNCNRTEAGLSGQSEQRESWFKGCVNLEDVSFCFYNNKYWEWAIPGDLFADCPRIETISSIFERCIRMLPSIPYNLFKACHKSIKYAYNTFNLFGFEYYNNHSSPDFPWRNVLYPSKNYGPLWPYMDPSTEKPKDGFISQTPFISQKIQEFGGPNQGSAKYIEFVYGKDRAAAGFPDGVNIHWAGEAPE